MCAFRQIGADKSAAKRLTVPFLSVHIQRPAILIRDGKNQSARLCDVHVSLYPGIGNFRHFHRLCGKRLIGRTKRHEIQPVNHKLHQLIGGVSNFYLFSRLTISQIQNISVGNFCKASGSSRAYLLLQIVNARLAVGGIIICGILRDKRALSRL